MTKAHTLSASQVAAFPNVLRSQETIDPMIPGSAATAVLAKLVRARPRACRCFLIHSLTPPLSDGFGAGDGVPPAPPPVTSRTRVFIAMPIAVRMLAIVIRRREFEFAQPASCLHGGAAWWSHEFCWSATGELLYSWRGLRASPAFQARCRRARLIASPFGLEYLVEFWCRPFRSVFGVPWPSAFRLRISGRRWRLASRGC